MSDKKNQKENNLKTEILETFDNIESTKERMKFLEKMNKYYDKSEQLKLRAVRKEDINNSDKNK